jgi:alanyl-tRNA synthetase
MKRLLPTLWTFILYFCLATLLAQMGIFVYLALFGGLDAARLARMVAVAQGIETAEAPTEVVTRKTDSTEQVSFEQILKERTAQSRSLQLREDALNNALEQLRAREEALEKRVQQERQAREAFERQLADIQEEAVAEGMENVRETLTKIDAGQAKDVLMGMYKNKEMRPIVLLLADMDNAKRARIVGEFQTPEERQAIQEILESLREGAPEGPLAEATKRQL